MAMQVDVECSLENIRDRHPHGLVSQLLEIQKHRVTKPKWLEWARNPPCLCRVSEKISRKRRRGEEGTQVFSASKTLRRVPRSGAAYVAVSYTSEPSELESNTTGGYRITESAQGGSATPTKVRDCVLSRATKYAEHHGIDRIWIDDECIDRDNANEHEMAMQSMDLIYSFSQHPVGLLTRPIKSQRCLDLLQNLLHSGFVEPVGNRDVLGDISAKMATEVVHLLYDITSDKWWTRAWIFQEDYCSSVRMTLLIPLDSSITQARGKWCSIPGELQLNSANFHNQSTLFCLAFLRKAGEEWQGGRKKCEHILSRAKKYSVVYGDLARHGLSRKAMSPSIFKDIGSRKISVASDLLAIAANCCNYSVRLDTKRPGGTSCSLSISILALYLLNGEIIMNHQDDESLLSQNIFDYLQQLALDDIDPPVENKELTFIKSCRLVDVRLSLDGIVTSGRLWKLHKAIDTGLFTSQTQPEREYPNGLNSYQRSQLRRLSEDLRLQGYETFATDLDDYLQEDAEDLSYPSKQYKDLMAEVVVEAIRERRTIHLGCLVGRNPYRGIFVTDAALEIPSHAFTAWSRAGSGVKALDKIVSLGVDVEDLEGSLRLKTKRWINGLCFFDGDPAYEVVFSYPKSWTG